MRRELSDALRFEVRGFGVDVVLIEPGLIKTRFGETAAGSIDAATAEGDDPYADFNAAVGTATAEVYEGPLARLGGGPETVARAIERAMTSRRPKPSFPQPRPGRSPWASGLAWPCLCSAKGSPSA